MENLSKSNKSSEEDKYIDLIESLKKNGVIKEYVSRTFVEKVGEEKM